MNWSRYILLPFLALLLVSACSKEAKLERLLKRANKDFEAEKFERAEVEYRNVLALSPLNADAVGKLGLIYHAKGRLLPTFAFLQKAAELDPDNMEVRLKLGSTHLAMQNREEARNQATYVLEKKPGDEDALLLLADAVSGPKEMEQAMQWINRLTGDGRNSPGLHVALGSLYQRQNDLDRAEAEYKRALAIDDRHSTAHRALGQLYLVRNDLENAERELKAAAEFAPLRSTGRFPYAQLLMRSGKVEEAKALIREITEEAPDYEPAWTFLAQTAFSQGDREECAELVGKLLGRNPGNFDGLLLKGRLMMAERKGTNAVAHFEEMAQSNFGRVPQVHFELARAHLLNQNAVQAAGSLDQAIQLNPGFTEAILLRSELDLRRNRPEAAVTALTQLAEQQPESPGVQLRLADAHLAQGNEEAALAIYDHLIAAFPNSHHVPFLKGRLMVRRNERAQARELFERALELSPGYVPAMEQLVDLEMLDENYEAAMARVKEAMEQLPEEAEPWLLEAKVHMVQSNLEKAEQALLTAIGKNPELQMPYMLLPRVYVALDKYPEALQRLRETVEKNTNNVAAMMQIGVIEEHLGHYAAARDAYEKLLKVNAQFVPALNNLAYLYSERLAEPKRAFELANRARELGPNDPAIADTLGWILYQRGEHARALALLQEAANGLPGVAEIQFHLGMTHYVLGNEGRARNHLSQGLDETAQFSGKEEGLRRLEILATDLEEAGPEERDQLEQWVKQHPKDTIALRFLAGIYEKTGRAAEAVQTYEQVLRQSPRNVAAMRSLASIYSRTGESKKAMETAMEAHKLAPGDGYNSHILGRLVYNSGDHKWAASLLGESARRLPQEPQVLYDLAWSQFSLGRVSESVATMQSAVDAGLSGSQLEAAQQFREMLEAAQSSGRSQGSVALADQILQRDPSYVPALLVRARALQDAGKYQEAAAAYDRILARFPFFGPATRDLAIIYAEHVPDDEKGYRLATEARSLYPNDAEVAKALGILSYRRGDFARSSRLLEEGARSRTGDADLLFYLGMSHYKLKDREKSKEALSGALGMNQLSQERKQEAERIIAELN